MTKRVLGHWSLGLLVVLIIPFSIAGSATQEQNALLPEGIVPALHQMPIPAPQDQFDAAVNADTFASRRMICPEVIWAAASGGGTWVSEVQITDRSGGSIVSGFYYHAGGTVTFSNLVTGLTYGQAASFSNILSTIASMTGATTYGTVGTLWLYTQDDSHTIMVDVETTNGNYGKSFPGVRWTDDNSINIGRPGFIQNMTNTSTWRTFVGGFNGASGGWTMVVRFYVLHPTQWAYYGSYFDKTVGSWDFTSFNPFHEAGIGAYSLDHCRLYAVVQSADPSPYEKGMFIFGSKANNITNDTSALFFKR